MNGTHDIIEEVIRIYGYEHVDPKPLYGEVRIPTHEAGVAIQHVVEDTLAKQFHMDQCETYPWLNERYLELFHVDTSHLYQLQNPAAPELQYLRDAMIYGLLDVLTKNYKTIDTINLFDTGKVWVWENDIRVEQKHLGIISYRATRENRQQDPRFFTKQAVEQVLINNRITGSISYKLTTASHFHKNKQCEIYV